MITVLIFVQSFYKKVFNCNISIIFFFSSMSSSKNFQFSNTLKRSKSSRNVLLTCTWRNNWYNDFSFSNSGGGSYQNFFLSLFEKFYTFTKSDYILLFFLIDFFIYIRINVLQNTCERLLVFLNHRFQLNIHLLTAWFYEYHIACLRKP